jgi:putative NADH-flavin reductase
VQPTKNNLLLVIFSKGNQLMKIVIFGATGQTGQQVLSQALQRGHQVTAAVRRPEALTLRHEHLAVVRADFSDQNSVETALSGQHAALSAVGAPMSRAHTSVHYDSARSILAAMQKTGVSRLICVTSGGTNPQHDPDLPFFFEQIFKRMFINIYRDQMEMEKIVMESNLDWTVVRPAALTNRATTGRCRTALAYAIRGGNETPRADLAAFMLDQLETSTYVRKAVALAI